MAISKQRYVAAQSYEEEYWESRRTSISGLIPDLLGSYDLAVHMERLGLLNRRWQRVLDVGCGGLGIGSSWLVSGECKVALDPLRVRNVEFSNSPLRAFVDEAISGVNYVEGMAESMSFADGEFDFVICNNVLDHVMGPAQILSEIHRVLSSSGIFAFSVDTHSWRTFIIKKLIKAVNPSYGDLPGHPHEWTQESMAALLARHGFKVIDHKRRSVKGRVAGGIFRSTWILGK